MTITLELPHELENELSAEAAQLGLPLSEYALRVLTFGRDVANAPKTGADLVAYWQKEGVIGMRPEIENSQAHARQLRAEAERRQRE
ncbi:MAG TPA: hypothetical protein VKI65_01965 [Gemmataceae bacterium]|nr:hypothetical protein [Gemmataceae bacterium]